ncbi:MAG: LacI family DNA-binding transcriptional regulator [Planctomycetota bacterium]
MNVQKIAELAKTSPASVSLVLNNKWRKKVNLLVAKRVMRIVDKHAYVRNSAGRGLAMQRSFRVALCVEGSLAEHPVMGWFSFHEHFFIITAKLNDAGYAIDILQQPAQRGELSGKKRSMLQNDDATIFLAPEAFNKAHFYDDFKIQKPFLVVDADLKDPDLCYIYTDSCASTEEAISYFLANGHKRVGFIAHDKGIKPDTRFENKIRGYKKALLKYDIGFDPRLVFKKGSKNFMQLGVNGGQELFSLVDRPTAFFCTDNMHAIGLLTYLREGGIRVPEDVEIIGFGDQAVAELCEPSISYIRRPIKEMAELGVDKILKWLDEKEDFAPIQIECKEELMLRGSTRIQNTAK